VYHHPRPYHRATLTAHLLETEENGHDNERWRCWATDTHLLL
jgi:hypothetical protein